MIGRPTILTPARADALIDAIRDGASPNRASTDALVSSTAVANWVRRGHAERARLDELHPDGWTDKDVTKSEQIYVAFVARVENAQKEWEQEALAAIREAGVGEEFVETVVTEVSGVLGVQRTETVRVKKTKSWQALAWLLERRMPGEYARVSRTEVTGADGGPIALAQRAQRILDALEDNTDTTP